VPECSEHPPRAEPWLQPYERHESGGETPTGARKGDDSPGVSHYGKPCVPPAQTKPGTKPGAAEPQQDTGTDKNRTGETRQTTPKQRSPSPARVRRPRGDSSQAMRDDRVAPKYRPRRLLSPTATPTQRHVHPRPSPPPRQGSEGGDPSRAPRSAPDRVVAYARYAPPGLRSGWGL
jgi:hypothetical protein